MDLLEALNEIPRIVADYRATKAELAETKRELDLLKSDGYVSWTWVCSYFDVSEPVARQMLQNEKVMVYGRKVKKFRRSDIVRFAERHSVKLKDLSLKD